MVTVKQYRIAVLWRGDRASRRAATAQNNRFHRVFEELAALGIDAEPAVYADDIADEVHQQLLAVDGVLVWVDPISGGETRAGVAPTLCGVAGARSLGQRSPRCDPQDGRQGSPLPHEASRLGRRYPALPYRSRFRCRVSR